jgi:hypothetical protein
VRNVEATPLDAELAEIRRHRTMARQQLEAAERAQAGIAVATGRLVAIRDSMEVLCARIAQASQERQNIVRTLVGRGGAVLEGRRVRPTLLVAVDECDSVPASMQAVQACATG